MKIIKKVWNKIKEPKNIWLFLFYVIFTAVVATTLYLVISNHSRGILDYFMYFASAVGLAYFIYTIVYFVKKIKGKLFTKLKKHKKAKIFLENADIRAIIYAFFGFLINVGYVAFQLVMGIITGSVWYITISVYYLILIGIKSAIIFRQKKHKQNEHMAVKTYRQTGIMYIFLAFAMFAIMVLVNETNMSFKYAGIMIYVVAIYTFIKIITAIVQTVKARKNNNFYIKSIRNTNLVSALYSLLVLQVAMFQAFAKSINTKLFNNITTLAVAVIIFSMSVYMIIKSNMQKKQLQNKDLSNSQINSVIDSKQEVLTGQEEQNNQNNT